MINEIVEEFISKCTDEKTKNKKVGLYIKKEFVNSINEEISKIKKSIKDTN